MIVHDPNGPSQLAKREFCPGSARMEEAVRLSDSVEFGDKFVESSDAAAMGTKLHDIIADCLRCDRRPSPEDYPAWDEEAIAALTFCYDEAQSDILTSDIENDLVLIEVRLDLNGLGIPKGGTIDFAVVRPGEWFKLRDWKFGAMPVKAPCYNRQMQAYAWGLCEQYGCQTGWAAVVQPQSPIPVKSNTFTAAELKECGDAIRVIVDRANQPDAPLIPGDHCMLCRAQSKCPARRAIAEAVIANKPAPTLATLRGMEPAKRLDFYERLKLAKAWVEGALGEVEGAVMEDRIVIPGLMVGEGRRSRAWVSEQDAAKVLEEVVGADRVYNRKMISPAEAERVAGKDRVTKAKLNAVIVTHAGKPRVVRVGTTGSVDE